MADGMNDFRAVRIAEIMNDFRTLQYYISQTKANPTRPEDYYEEGYVVLRQCISDGQAVLSSNFNASDSTASSASGEREKAQLQRIMLDASARRFQAQKIYLRAMAATRWANSRAVILQGQKPQAGHLPSLQAASEGLRTELAAISDQKIHSDLLTADYHAGRWIQEDPSLSTILNWIHSSR
ncbi:MAG: hypothetical protein M1813_005179 [Trichoglossum hirsutum]|nr:MAG: hypothetical protein M1813_005179 [Trichoglossum hirsutum]